MIRSGLSTDHYYEVMNNALKRVNNDDYTMLHYPLFINKSDTFLQAQENLTNHCISRLDSLENKTILNHGAALLAAIKQCQNSSKENWPKKIEGRRLSQTQDALVDVLMAVLRARGAEHEVSPALLANRKELENLILGQTDSPVLHGWRAELAGHDLQAVLSGKRVIQVTDGRLELRDV